MLFEVTKDRAFARIVRLCADREDTWINAEIEASYIRLHEAGRAHSIEVWQDGELAGGLYGVRLGAAFFGESMVSLRPDASKVALAWLVARLIVGGFRLLDCQFMTPHLASLGAVEIDQKDYLVLLDSALGGGARRRGRRLDRRPGRIRGARPAACGAGRRRRRAAAGVGHCAAPRPDVVDGVLDDVERGRFLVEPAREDAPELLGRRFAHVELDEGAGQLLHLTGRARLAGAQADDDVAEPDRLARPDGELAHLAVAFVEQPQHGDALGHRRRPGRLAGHGLRDVDGIGLRLGGVLPVLLLGAAGPAGGEGEQRRQRQDLGRPRRHRSVGDPGLIVAARRRPPAAALERAGRPIGAARCRSGWASRP